MAEVNDKSRKNFRTARLELGGGWRAWVGLRDPDGLELTESQWRQCLGDPEKLLEGPIDTLKSDGRNRVIVKELRVGDKKLVVVVKSQRSSVSVRNFLRSFFAARSVRNFRTAMRLCSAGIATSYPLAALRQKKGFLTNHSIYISEYIADSCCLYEFLRNRLGRIGRDEFQKRKRLALQTGCLLAGLHREGLWHRDAKASNFLVRFGASDAAADCCDVFLVDMDGINPYFLRRRARQLGSLAKLGSTVLCHGAISRTDYLRTFMAYSKMLNLDAVARRRIYRKLAEMSMATRLLTMANTVIEGRGIIVEDN